LVLNFLNYFLSLSYFGLEHFSAIIFSVFDILGKSILLGILPIGCESCLLPGGKKSSWKLGIGSRLPTKWMLGLSGVAHKAIAAVIQDRTDVRA